ncbi:MAG: DMT family transporter [Paracoccaceae bacterium]|nr:DMT family transporter [Paracoccaceae bacterium]MDG2259087.1 DMT family transporter [Paracoccaceae bacterium]
MTAAAKASIWMSGAIVSFTLMAVAGRAVSLDLDTFEIMMYRSIIGFLIVVAILGSLGKISQIRANRLGIHFLRNSGHFIGQNLWFFAITVAPLAQVFALEFTSPIWAIFLAAIILGERLTLIKVTVAVFGFIGVLIVSRPFGGSLDIGLLAAGVSAIGFAGSAVFTRLLTRTETIASILFFLTLMQFVFGLVCAGVDGDITAPTIANAPWLALIAVCGLMAHFCLTTALSLAPAAIVMPIDFIRLPVIAVVGMLFYAEVLDWYVFLGAAIIFGANYFNIWHSSRTAK